MPAWAYQIEITANYDMTYKLGDTIYCKRDTLTWVGSPKLQNKHCLTYICWYLVNPHFMTASLVQCKKTVHSKDYGLMGNSKREILTFYC